MTVLTERPGAHFALKRSFSCVGSHMSLQVIDPIESSSANFTLVVRCYYFSRVFNTSFAIVSPRVLRRVLGPRELSKQIVNTLLVLLEEINPTESLFTYITFVGRW